MKLFVLSIAFLCSTQVAFAINIQVGDVKDSRTTGQFFAGFEIDLKLIGDEIGDAKAIRTSIVSAVDSTGRDLIDPSKIEKDFKEVGSYGASDNKVTVNLKNPSRKAETLKELKGQIELFVPKNDPQSTVVLRGFKQHSGKVIDSPALKSSGIELAFYDSQQAEEQQKKEAEAKAAEMRKQGMDESMIKMASGFMGGFGGGDGNSVTLKIKDPGKKLVGIEFQTSAGQKISSNSSMSSGETIVKYFNEPIPADGQVSIFVASDKALVKVPVELANVALP